MEITPLLVLLLLTTFNMCEVLLPMTVLGYSFSFSLDRFCGDKLHGAKYSSEEPGASFTVQFMSDASHTAQGFSILYRFGKATSFLLANFGVSRPINGQGVVGQMNPTYVNNDTYVNNKCDKFYDMRPRSLGGYKY